MSEELIPPLEERFTAEDYEGSVPTFLATFRRWLRLRNSLAIEKILRLLLTRASIWARWKPNARVRPLLQTAFPINPLSSSRELPHIELIVPFVEKDIDVLAHCVRSAVSNIRNPLSRIRLVTPAGPDASKPNFSSVESTETLKKILAEHPSSSIEFDQNLLGEEALRRLRESGAKGWDIQQMIKFAAVLTSESDACLILDSDTVLLAEKTWFLDSKKQLLQVANEYEERYMPLIREYFGLQKQFPMSFVTHHQLMQKEVVQEMFPDGISSLTDWWETSRRISGSHLSEFESYGSYLFERHPERVILGSWCNLLSPHFARFNQLLTQRGTSPSSLINDYCSVSFHAQTQQG